MKKLFTTLLLSLSFTALADLPRIDAPRELIHGEFAEGTVTQLSAAEVAEFLPWAQNAHNQLTRALTNTRSLPLRDRRPLLERAIKSVVMRSGDRQYQMFMRFSLNRGLLLVSEMEKHMNMEEIGAQENALDILQRSINVALSFYEGDLSFQRRSQNGALTTELSYARFAASYMAQIYPGVLNIFDSQAQYRLLYKLIEMVNWDLSRDAHALNYAEAIVEAHEALTDLPDSPLAESKANLRLIRRLKMLRILSVQHAQNRGEVSIPATTTPVTPGTRPTPAPLPSQLGGYANLYYSGISGNRYCYRVDINGDRIGSSSNTVEDAHCQAGYANLYYSGWSGNRYCYRVDKDGNRIGSNSSVVEDSYCVAGYANLHSSGSSGNRYCYKVDEDGNRIGSNSNVVDDSHCHVSYANLFYSGSSGNRYCYKVDAHGNRIGSNSNIVDARYCGF
jgi:catechol 2,3-dioxygenase-like lactoylglutathione lyase family enzyme